MRSYAASRRGSLNSFESLMPSISKPSGRIGGGHEGPREGPRPASSAPATRVNPAPRAAARTDPSSPHDSILAGGQTRRNATPITRSSGTRPVHPGGRIASHPNCPDCRRGRIACHRAPSWVGNPAWEPAGSDTAPPPADRSRRGAGAVDLDRVAGKTSPPASRNPRAAGSPRRGSRRASAGLRRRGRDRGSRVGTLEDDHVAAIDVVETQADAADQDPISRSASAPSTPTDRERLHDDELDRDREQHRGAHEHGKLTPAAASVRFEGEAVGSATPVAHRPRIRLGLLLVGGLRLVEARPRSAASGAADASPRPRPPSRPLRPRTPRRRPRPPRPRFPRPRRPSRPPPRPP